jgi:hypothetical protein
MGSRNILSQRLTIPRKETAGKEKRPGHAEKVVMVRGFPITLKWVESLQCWCGDPNGLLKARREKAEKVVSGSPWRMPAARIPRRKREGRRAAGT